MPRAKLPPFAHTGIKLTELPLQDKAQYVLVTQVCAFLCLLFRFQAFLLTINPCFGVCSLLCMHLPTQLKHVAAATSHLVGRHQDRELTSCLPFLHPYESAHPLHNQQMSYMCLTCLYRVSPLLWGATVLHARGHCEAHGGGRAARLASGCAHSIAHPLPSPMVFTQGLATVVGLSVVRLVTAKPMEEAGQPGSPKDALFNYSPSVSCLPFKAPGSPYSLFSLAC